MYRTILLALLMVFAAGNFIPISADEETAEILYEKGLADFNKKSFQAAESAFLKALEAFPGHLKSCIKLAELYETNPKKQQDALNYYTRAVNILAEKNKLSDDEESIKTAAEKKIDQLDKLGSRLKTERANYVNKILSIAAEAKRTKRYDLAERLYDEVMAVAPKNADALEGKKELGKLKKADEPAAGKPGPGNNSGGDRNGSGGGDEIALFNGEDLESLKEEEGEWEVVDGELRATSRGGGCIIYKPKKFEGKYDIELEFAVGEEFNVGVIMGFNGVTEKSFAVSLSERAFLFAKSELKNTDRGATVNLSVLSNGVQNKINADDWNKLKITLDTNTVSAFLNDEELFENKKINEEIKGKIGIITSDSGVRVRTFKVKTQAMDEQD